MSTAEQDSSTEQHGAHPSEDNERRDLFHLVEKDARSRATLERIERAATDPEAEDGRRRILNVSSFSCAKVGTLTSSQARERRAQAIAKYVLVSLGAETDADLRVGRQPPKFRDRFHESVSDTNLSRTTFSMSVYCRECFQ